MKQKQPTADIHFIQFDMTSVASAQAAAAQLNKESRIDIIIANAGVMAFPYKLINGVEVQFVSHSHCYYHPVTTN
jgi:NAD(P)-dependent dehydrogenase (short-subunit alcohol dehydrogenase family)